MQYSKINNLLDRYLNLYDSKPVHTSDISLSTIASKDTSSGSAAKHSASPSHQTSFSAYKP